MNYNKKTVYDIDVAGKKVLLRCDFNVPQDKVTGAITSDKRIVAALPTIRYLLGQGAAVIACSHLGKPEPSFEKWVKKQTEKGKDPAELTEEKWQKSLKKLTLAPVAERLSELLGKPVVFAHDVVGPDAKAKAAALRGGEIMLLENTRFEKGETKNDPALAKELAPSGIRVNCITPGMIDTEMNACYTEEEKKDITSEIPLERMGTAEDVAELFYFLSSPNAAYLTGQVIGVNGGWNI